MSFKKLSLVIPCFNESYNVTIVIQKLHDLIRKNKANLEVIIVDGGSKDGTQEKLREVFIGLPVENFKLILKDRPGGYGGDIMEGLGHATGDILAWTHADLQTDPTDVLIALNKFLTSKGDVLVKGQRFNRRPIEWIFTFGMELVVWFKLGRRLSDINAQPKMFSRHFYANFLVNDYPSDFSLDLYTLYKAASAGYQIETIPVYFSARTSGEAKGGGGGWKMRLNLIRRTYNYINKLSVKLK